MNTEYLAGRLPGETWKQAADRWETAVPPGGSRDKSDGGIAALLWAKYYCALAMAASTPEERASFEKCAANELASAAITLGRAGTWSDNKARGWWEARAGRVYFVPLGGPFRSWSMPVESEADIPASYEIQP